MSSYDRQGDHVPLLHEDPHYREEDAAAYDGSSGVVTTESRPASPLTHSPTLDPFASEEPNVSRTLPETATFGRNLGWFHVYSLVVSRIIGSGIFATPGSIYRSVGSVGLSLILWVVGAAIAVCALTVSLEYGCMLPRSGGDKVYLEFTYSKPKYLASIVFAFYTIFLYSVASNCIVFGEYLTFALGLPPTKLANRGFALLLLTSLVVIARGDGTNDRSSLFEGSIWGWGSMSTAVLKITYAYMGFASANDVMNEIKNPVRTLKTATTAALATVCLMYFFVNMAYFSVVDGEDIRNSGELIAGLFFERVFGYSVGRRVLSLAVAVSTAGNVMVGLFSQSRLNQEVARQGVIPFSKFFASSKPFNAPLAALSINFIQAFFIITFTPPADIYAFILDVQSYAQQFVALAVVIGLILLRRKQPDLKRPYKAPSAAVVVRIATCVALLIAPFIRPAGGKGDVRFWYGTYAVATVLVFFVAGSYWYIWTVYLPTKGRYELVERPEVLDDGTTVTTLVKESRT
ncbi:hypothetical protein AOL_s00054g979 [Orbilia oligospora ATCC 24927]|uniref:Methionine permease n=1 Tax=Arthrobotrys oligospora (strain ATCC 24927 / CBS 115.81 / DSM 1491) TaxID=756982 RepID=G1X7R2_ARTOA|nr:hypothetical protein AOL_s00054g979 [Orbilia oligospora ATCC 24927]EGX50893.1 hypothetical protein AOL_s00054g979 [Orbilia oligospora ATCC 24927]